MNTPKEIDLSKINIEEFTSRITKAGADECWNWNRGATGKGYGTFSINQGQGQRRKRVFMAHRIAATIAFGPIPSGHFVCHKCDNPTCCNPNHLFTGTLQQNNADTKAKGRLAKGNNHGAYTHPEQRVRGVKHPMAKLTNEKVVEIRKLKLEGHSHLRLAKVFGVSRSLIGLVSARKAWAHVP